MARQRLSSFVKLQLRELEREINRRRITVTTDRPNGVQTIRQRGKTARLPMQLAARGRSVKGSFN